MKARNAIIALFVASSVMFVASLYFCDIQYVKSEDTVHIRQYEIERFPSYDWDYEEGRMLAAIAHATEGGNADKQDAVIDCLHIVWETHGHPTITDYFNENYFGVNVENINEMDCYIVQCVIDGIRCSD